MDLFGIKFSLAMGAWRLRFVLMLEDVESPPARRPEEANSVSRFLKAPSHAHLN